MTNSKTMAAGQPTLNQLLADVLASDNWGALMRRYVSAPKQYPDTDHLNDRQLKDVGLMRANPGWINEPRRTQGDL
jgi:hypothetical protein